MKITNHFATIFGLMFLLASSSCCIFNRANSANSLSFKSISFGRSGGFTNLTEEYILNAQGCVLKVSGKDSTVINHIDKCHLNKINRQIKSIDFFSIDFKEYSNMNNFIRIESETKTNEVIWSQSSEIAQIKDLYKRLTNLLNNKSE